MTFLDPEEPSDGPIPFPMVGFNTEAVDGVDVHAACLHTPFIKGRHSIAMTLVYWPPRLAELAWFIIYVGHNSHSVVKMGRVF